MEQSRNQRNSAGTTGRHINTDAAINQKKAAQKKSEAAKRRGTRMARTAEKNRTAKKARPAGGAKAASGTKQAAKRSAPGTKPAAKQPAPGAKPAAKQPVSRQNIAKRPDQTQKSSSTARQKQNAKRNAHLQQARANGQQGPRTGARKKKKYKVNYRRLTTCIVGAFLIILLLVLIIRGIAHSGNKKGWYNVYIKPTSSDCRLGRVTELDESGVPKAVDLLKEVKDGVYALPIQCGGTSTLIVADEDYSFNKVNPYNREYYLASVQAEYSADAAKQAEFEDKYQPSIVEVVGQTITTNGMKDLPSIALYGKEHTKDKLAEAAVGAPQPSISVKELDYSGRKQPEAPAKTDETATFTFSASGDNLIHQKIYQQASTRAGGSGYDFNYCYESVSNFYQHHDLNWINQESLLSNKLGPASYPTFSTPGEDGQALYNLLNMRVFSVANNHVYDQGSSGIEATTEYYENDMPDDVLATGLWKKSDLDDIPVYSCKGRSIAFVSYTYGTNGISTPESADRRVVYTSETDIIEKQVERANKLADIVVVGCHWGTENSHVISADQKKLAQNLADWGADLIIGTHPHVVQNAEWINAEDGRKVFCAYSLGNFISTQALADQLVGLVLDCTIDTVTTPDGKVTVEIRNPKLIPVVTVYGNDYANVHTVWYKDFTETDAMNHGVKATNMGFSYAWIGTMLKQNVNTDFLDLPDESAANALNGELSEEPTSEGNSSSTVSTSAVTGVSNATGTAGYSTTSAATATRTASPVTTARATTVAATTASNGTTLGAGRSTNGVVGPAASGN